MPSIRMDKDEEAPRSLRPVAAVAAIVLLGAALYLPGLGREALRHPLEAKYALTAREMLRGGPLLVPHLFGDLYPDKPPLYFWATAALGWLGGGIDEVTARLPAVAGAVAGLLLTYRLGADLFGTRAGLFSALVLGTSNLYFWYARQGHPDQFLTAFVTLACLGLWHGLAPAEAPRRASWMALAYGAMALGALSKGLLGLVLPLLGAGAYAAATGPLRSVPRRLWLGPGLGVFLAVVLAWFGPAVARHGWAYFYEAVVHQHLVRYTRTWAHEGPWYYYLGEFPIGFFPWALFLPGAIALGWRATRGAAAGPWGTPPAAGPGPPPGPVSQPFLFLLSWFVTGFLFFSFSSGKRGPYLLPLYPAAALMVGPFLARVCSSGQRSRWVGVPLAVLSGLAVLLALGLALVPQDLIPGHRVDMLVPDDPWQLGGIVAVLVAGALALWLSWRRGGPAAALGALVALQAALLLVASAVRAPQSEARFPVREFAGRVEAAVPAGRPVLALLRYYGYVVGFYVGRPLVPVGGVPELLAAAPGEDPRYVLVDQEDPALLARPETHVVAETRLGPRRVMLLRLDPVRQ